MIKKMIINQFLKNVTVEDVCKYLLKSGGYIITIESLDKNIDLEITIKDKSS